MTEIVMNVSIPSRGFWFFEEGDNNEQARYQTSVSIPSRGFWFFEGNLSSASFARTPLMPSFNPLAGILVF